MTKQAEVGDRVYVPPREYGDPYTLAGPDCAVRTPGISGRVHRIDDGILGLVAVVREERSSALRSVPLDLCRVQSGRSRKERSEAGAEARKAARRKK